ncbi:MAG: periplasmic heavy metal sensor [Deltaproteobacteria bacterium]|nr:periplasmic heavy metal sensor [Deltaproteobacteria bacterium]
MKNKKTLIRVLVLVLALGLIASSAWAGGRGWGMGRMGGGGNHRWGNMPGSYMAGIDQNDPRYKFFKETEKERNELYQKHTEFRALLAAPKVDEEKVKALHNEITQLRNQMGEKHLQFTMELRKNNPDWRPGYGSGWGRGMKSGNKGFGGRGYGQGSYCW